MCGHRFCQLAAIVPLLGAAPPDALPSGTSRPSLQELEVAGRVLHFQADQPSGPVTVAVVYNPANADSRAEAAALMGLLANGLTVGDLVLQPVLVAQSHLVAGGAYRAVFDTIGVDDNLLGDALRQLQIPCITRHLQQVDHGACTVAIRSEPSVSIILSAANATADGVRFATAFRMMVDEL